jgi:hypothetical protein
MGSKSKESEREGGRERDKRKRERERDPNYYKEEWYRTEFKIATWSIS